MKAFTLWKKYLSMDGFTHMNAWYTCLFRLQSEQIWATSNSSSLITFFERKKPFLPSLGYQDKIKSNSEIIFYIHVFIYLYLYIELNEDMWTFSWKDDRVLESHVDEYPSQEHKYHEKKLFYNNKH